jgi:hypothetical protein
MNKTSSEKSTSKDQKLLLEDYVNIKEICNLYPHFKESTLRYYIAKKKQNIGMCAARRGGRVLFHKKKFVEWANSIVKDDYYY